MLELGKAYYFGTIVKGDKELAKKWLQKAKDRGSKEAGELLKKIEAQEKR
jgi:TPR repeat protein